LTAVSVFLLAMLVFMALPAGFITPNVSFVRVVTGTLNNPTTFNNNPSQKKAHEFLKDPLVLVFTQKWLLFGNLSQIQNPKKNQGQFPFLQINPFQWDKTLPSALLSWSLLPINQKQLPMETLGLVFVNSTYNNWKSFLLIEKITTEFNSRFGKKAFAPQLFFAELFS